MRAIAVAGMMGAGKTAVSSALQTEQGFSALGFGDVVRAEADARGVDSSDRAALQTLGQALFVELGADGMVDRLLDGADGDIVIDGVRHVPVLDCLQRRLAALVFGFIYADEAELDRRWNLRGETLSRIQANSHGVEDNLELLRRRADVVINTSIFTPSIIATMLTVAASSRSDGGDKQSS